MRSTASVYLKALSTLVHRALESIGGWGFRLEVLHEIVYQAKKIPGLSSNCDPQKMLKSVSVLQY